MKSAPAVQSKITGGEVSITGKFTLKEAQSLKTVLDSGSLPVTLKYSESRVVGPTLGQDSLTQGVVAIAVGVAIVVVYLFVFYRASACSRWARLRCSASSTSASLRRSRTSACSRSRCRALPASF